MSLETNIFLVRHGETEWNTQNRLQGNKDSPLTLVGMKQANKVKESLQHVSIDRAYVRPLKLSRDTLEIIVTDS